MNWKDIPGYEGLYQISDCGKVKSLDRVVYNHLGPKRIKGSMLSLRIKDNGYYFISLYKEGKLKNLYIHRLVMYAHSHIDESLTVNHIDEDKSNNHISNLEYCTHHDNVKKFIKNNPNHLDKTSIATKNKLGYKWLDSHTGIVYNSTVEVGEMMFKTGNAKNKWTWVNILRFKKQDRFIRIN